MTAVFTLRCVSPFCLSQNLHSVLWVQYEGSLFIMVCQVFLKNLHLVWQCTLREVFKLYKLVYWSFYNYTQVCQHTFRAIFTLWNAGDISKGSRLTSLTSCSALLTTETVKPHTTITHWNSGATYYNYALKQWNHTLQLCTETMKPYTTIIHWTAKPHAAIIH